MNYIPKKYKIINATRFTLDTVLFRIKSNLNPSPGQFVEVSIPGIGECPISVCSYNKNYIDILVRNVGSVTNAICKLKKNDFIYLRGPYGNGFPMQLFKNKSIVLIGGGCGVAPIKSISEYVEANKKDFKSLYLFFGFKSSKNILFKDYIDKWCKSCNMILSIDNPEKNWKYYTGLIPDVIKKYSSNSPNFLQKDKYFFICGPPIMIKLTVERLNKLDFTNDRVYISLERRMECGHGKCGRCMIHGQYVCKDGPVFNYNDIKEYKND